MSCGKSEQHGEYGTPEYEFRMLQAFVIAANNRDTPVIVTDQTVVIGGRFAGEAYPVDRITKLPHPDFDRLKKVILVYERIP